MIRTGHLARPMVATVAAMAFLLAACAGDDDSSTSGSGTTATSTAGSTDTTADAASTSVTPSTSAAAPTSAPTPSAPTTPPSTAPAPASSNPPDGAGDAVPPPGFPPQPSGVAWPTEAWPEAEFPLGVDRAAIDDAVATGFGSADNEARVRSVLIVQGGSIVYERYHPLDSADTVFPSFSVAKSFTSALVGSIVDDGLLDVDAPAPVDEWQASGDPRAEITTADLLHMSSGLEWTEEYGPGSAALRMFGAEHAAAVPIEAPLASEPGTVYNYSTGTSAILADIVADVLGGTEAFDEYVGERLLDPLGMSSVELMRDGSGHFLGGIGFNTTARDFARFGLLYLRGGVWDGETILSPEWIEYTLTPSPTNPEYGAHWWLRGGTDDAFAALGLFGQQIVVVPSLDLIVVTTANQGSDPYAVAATIVDAFAAAG